MFVIVVLYFGKELGLISSKLLCLCCICGLLESQGTVSSAVAHLSLTRIDYHAIDKYANPVSITRNFAYTCWLLGTSETSVKIQGWMTGQIFSDLILFLLSDCLRREVSQESDCRAVAELTVFYK